MKFIIFCSLLMSAHIATADYTHFGRILFQSASTYIPANKVCRMGNFLYSKTAETVTVEICNDSNENCRKITKVLKQPVKSTRQRCAKYTSNKCRKFKTVKFNQGTVNVHVYDRFKSFEEQATPLKIFKYTVDSCNN